MSETLEEPKQLKNWETATELEKLENAQEFNIYRINKLKPHNTLTAEGRAQLNRNKNQKAILATKIKNLKP